MKVEFFGSSSGGGGGTDTNLGNSNLSADATTRSYTMASGGNLEIKNNSGNNIVDFTSTNLEIGNTNKYTMPNARGSANQILGQTNATGNIAFRTMQNTITNQAQTCAGNGRVTETTIASRNVFVPNGNGGLTNLGSSASVTTLTGDQIATLCPPFRQNSGTDYGFATGSDRIIVKLEASFTDTFNIILVTCDMNTGTSVASTPVSFNNLGTITLNRSGQWFCEVFNPADAEISLETCAVAWVGVSANTGTEESVNMHLLSNYLNAREITQSYI